MKKIIIYKTWKLKPILIQDIHLVRYKLEAMTSLTDMIGIQILKYLKCQDSFIKLKMYKTEISFKKKRMFF